MPDHKPNYIAIMDVELSDAFLDQFIASMVAKSEVGSLAKRFQSLVNPNRPITMRRDDARNIVRNYLDVEVD